MSLKGLIFDLEGVIVFTDQYHYKAWKQMADEKGIYFCLLYTSDAADE